MVSVHEFGSKWSSISVKISSSLELILRAQTLAQKSHESADKATALLQEPSPQLPTRPPIPRSARTLLEQLDSIAEGANRAANAERQKLKELKLVEEEENRKKAEAERQRLVLEARKAAAVILNPHIRHVMNSPAADSASTLPTVIVPSRTTSLPIPVQPAPHAEENSRDETPLGVRSKINLPTTSNLSLGMGPPSALNDVASTFNAQSPLSHSSSVPSQKPAICSESKQTPNSPLSMGKLFRDTASVGPKIKLEEEETKPIRTNPSVQPLTQVSVSTVSTCMHPQVAQYGDSSLSRQYRQIPDSIAGGSSQPPRKKLSPASASKSGAIAPTKRPIRDAVQANIPTRTAAAPLPPCSQVVRIVPPAASTGIVPSPTALSSTGGLSQPPKHKLPAKPVFASAPLKSQETGGNVSKTRKPPVSRVST
ncbi:hypothetical protein BT96DRAFT_972172 [Gymnopus androsaceus JB14]|uniref:Uncharacterized protein n=1 Tax=Gymnopus androsaceus JB14 TaxID=1447944 RepID=A0A6A4I9E5_9AGAR|nr:hypothetical protein BT96DRAFT_972172 [Gymnopus androsaceus JB14]